MQICIARRLDLNLISLAPVTGATWLARLVGNSIRKSGVIQTTRM